jgi:hypothetical protein
MGGKMSTTPPLTDSMNARNEEVMSQYQSSLKLVKGGDEIVDNGLDEDAPVLEDPSTISPIKETEIDSETFAVPQQTCYNITVKRKSSSKFCG